MLDPKEKCFIKVFITKSNKFRAEIKSESFPHKTEVTVGGEKWKGKEFDPFRVRILKKCSNILDNMRCEFLKVAS